MRGGSDHDAAVAGTEVEHHVIGLHPRQLEHRHRHRLR
jgi:hypothetical protein